MAFDPHCRRIVGNARAHALLGIPMGENVSAAPGGSEDAGYVVARGGKAVSGQELPMQFAARTGNSTIEEELEIVRKDGSRITILMSAAPLRDESGAVVGSVGTFQDITGRKRTEDALESSLLEKDVLMRELAHRTKNNMQVIGSLITLQAAALGDRKFVDALKDTKDRIRAMALVHENIYRSDNLASLGMNGYARDLISSLLRAHRGRNGTVTPVFDIEDIPIPVDAAVALGLIINELTTNSLKHAFSGGKPGMIRLAIRRDGEGVEVRYGDDGPGLPPGIDVSRCRTLGLKIVHGIAVLQLRGKMEVRGEPMPGFVFRFAGFSHMEGKAE
jgi:two-component sensor histidine kinase